MKAVILAGGYGTRLGEETNVKPKPMIEIGGKPILWHIMKIYSAHNINDFVICSGYKGDIIKGWADKYNDNNTAWKPCVEDRRFMPSKIALADANANRSSMRRAKRQTRR